MNRKSYTLINTPSSINKLNIKNNKHTIYETRM